MSLVSFIGPKPNLLDINAVNPPMRLEVSQPVLDFDDMARLRNIEKHTGGKFKAYEIDITYPASGVMKVSRRVWPRCVPKPWKPSSPAQHPDRDRPQDGPRQHRHPGAARPVGHPPPSGSQGPAHLDRSGGGNRHRP
jgi:hypothetical protein